MFFGCLPWSENGRHKIMAWVDRRGVTHVSKPLKSFAGQWFCRFFLDTCPPTFCPVSSPGNTFRCCGQDGRFTEKNNRRLPAKSKWYCSCFFSVFSVFLQKSPFLHKYLAGIRVARTLLLVLYTICCQKNYAISTKQIIAEMLALTFVLDLYIILLSIMRKYISTHTRR